MAIEYLIVTSVCDNVAQIDSILIRCKNCMHWCRKDERCENENGLMWAKPNGYCPYAEEYKEK